MLLRSSGSSDSKFSAVESGGRHYALIGVGQMPDGEIRLEALLHLGNNRHVLLNRPVLCHEVLGRVAQARESGCCSTSRESPGPAGPPDSPRTGKPDTPPRTRSPTRRRSRRRSSWKGLFRTRDLTPLVSDNLTRVISFQFPGKGGPGSPRQVPDRGRTRGRIQSAIASSSNLPDARASILSTTSSPGATRSNPLRPRKMTAARNEIRLFPSRNGWLVQIPKT